MAKVQLRKENQLFDLWSFAHLAFGFMLAYVIRSIELVIIIVVVYELLEYLFLNAVLFRAREYGINYLGDFISTFSGVAIYFILTLNGIIY